MDRLPTEQGQRSYLFHAQIRNPVWDIGASKLCSGNSTYDKYYWSQSTDLGHNWESLGEKKSLDPKHLTIPGSNDWKENHAIKIRCQKNQCDGQRKCNKTHEWLRKLWDNPVTTALEKAKQRLVALEEWLKRYNNDNDDDKDDTDNDNYDDNEDNNDNESDDINNDDDNEDDIENENDNESDDINNDDDNNDDDNNNKY